METFRGMNHCSCADGRNESLVFRQQKNKKLGGTSGGWRDWKRAGAGGWVAAEAEGEKKCSACAAADQLTVDTLACVLEFSESGCS